MTEAKITKFETLESKLINYSGTIVIIDRDVAELFGVETKEVNKAVKNNPDKFPNGYILELTKAEKNELVKNFHRFSSLKHSTVPPKAFTEKGLYMLATILKSEVATEARPFEFNLGFAKVSRSVKKIKSGQGKS